MKHIVLAILVCSLLVACDEKAPTVTEPKLDVPPYPELEPPVFGDNVAFSIDVMNEGPLPKRIVVEQGRQVKLLVRAVDGDHDFRIKEFGIAQQLPNMQEVPIEFIATPAGEYEVECVKNCHPGSSGILIIR